MKLLDSRHLRAKDATKIYDLGMGTGKLAVQGENHDAVMYSNIRRDPVMFPAFISYKNLKEIVGIEISPSRYSIGEAALRRMASKHPNKYTITKFVKGRTITLQTRKGKRKIRFDCGDLFTVTELHNVRNNTPHVPSMLVLLLEVPSG